MSIKRIGWENGRLVSKAKVQVDGIIYEVEPEQYEGATPLTAENLIAMEDNVADVLDLISGDHSIPILNGDFNNATRTGIYYYSNTMKNNPFSGFGILMVENKTYVTQIALNNYETTKGRVAVRTKQGDAWGEWTFLTSNINITTGEEFATNEYLAGSRIYGKRIVMGGLPNNSNKTVSTGLDMGKVAIRNIQAYIKAKDTANYYPLPFFSVGNQLQINYAIQPAGVINVVSNYDASGYDGFFTIYYTKI